MAQPAASRVKVITLCEELGIVVSELAAERGVSEDEAILDILRDWAMSQGLVGQHILDEDTPTLGSA